MATDPDPAPEVKSSCPHTWRQVFTIGQGDSIDTYFECPACTACLHVYTYAPYNIRHENLHAPGTWGNGWTRGYAQGMAYAADRAARGLDLGSVVTDSKSTTGR